MGRLEKPISGSCEALARFASDLRALRSRRVRTYRDLARITGISVTTLSQAASGNVLPTWRTTRLFVLGCGGSLQEWRRRWILMRRMIDQGLTNP